MSSEKYTPSLGGAALRGPPLNFAPIVWPSRVAGPPHQGKQGNYLGQTEQAMF
jgi:hypothetical protein